MITPLLALFFAAEVGSAPVAPVARPIVLVFDVEASDVLLPARARDALTEYLVARLAESSYRCVPRAELRRRIEASKLDSYAPCVDQSCQLELGKELAAEKTLSTKVLRLGDRRQVAAVLYDLRTAATETAATREAPCTEAALVAATRGIADQLSGRGPATVGAHATYTPEAAEHRPVAAPRTMPAPLADASLQHEEPPTLVTCGVDAGSPGIFGWCSRGTFYGPIHLGLIVFAGTARSFGGLAETALVNRVGGSFYGVVQGGLASFVGHDFYGAVQVSAVNYVGGDFVGLVQGGGYNQVDGTFTGIQAGVVNRARRAQGVQLGLLNVADELHGLQLGLVNVAGNGLVGVLPIFNAAF